MIPECPWRFGERYLATDFVQANNVAILEQATIFGHYFDDEQAFIEKVAKWIRDSFYYPLDNADNPAAQGQMLRHHKSLLQGYHAKKCVYYMWSLPNEILGFTHCGICIDTANLAGSILRAGGVEAWVTLGDVNSAKDGTLLGRHAWIEVPYKGIIHILETTIHDPGSINMIPATFVYDKNSDWAVKNGIYFVVQAKYNEREFKGEGPLGYGFVEIMGLPAHWVLNFGVQRTCQESNRRLEKEWRKEESIKMNILREAYRRL